KHRHGDTAVSVEAAGTGLLCRVGGVEDLMKKAGLGRARRGHVKRPRTGKRPAHVPVERLIRHSTRRANRTSEADNYHGQGQSESTHIQPPLCAWLGKRPTTSAEDPTQR